MTHFIGIDLGTTNSAICLYDGRETRVLKSPEQSDVTPSAICVDRRGRRYYGRRAYELAPVNATNSATLFKRYMGTSKQFTFEATGETLTPEECSAEILRVLFGYLPEEIRSDPDIATVITVPAAFNQGKKDATLEAARLAGIGRVMLMQEPVAAVMSVMKQDDGEKLFLVYDLGGGTFDISAAQCTGRRVSLLAQGGKEMCGGRDWDRAIYTQVVEPWLRQRFNLPADQANPDLQRIRRLALLAVEQAKIELSSAPDSAIRMDEERMNVVDLDGREVYLDIPLTRTGLDALIRPQIDETVEVTRETLAAAGLSCKDVGQIVFVGGPSAYAPLREKVSEALGIPQGTAVNPMTAVAEGAAIYGESVDWADARHGRKASVEGIAGQRVSVNYEARTTGDSGRVAIMVKGGGEVSAELTSLDTGWLSGRVTVSGRGILHAPLTRMGENAFRLDIYDAGGALLPLEEDRVVITRTLASVETIPASHAIAVKALDGVGGRPVPVYLVEKNEALPKRGSVTFHAGEKLVAGSSGALVFSLWEGEIREPIEDNRYIGTFRIPGSSFYSGVIPVGAELICEYEMSESGTLHLGVSIPCVGVSLAETNFYSRKEGQLDLEDASGLLRQSNALLDRVAMLRLKVNDAELLRLRQSLLDVRQVFEKEDDPETIQQAANELVDGRRRLARLRKRHAREVRKMDMDLYARLFEEVRGHASPDEVARYETLMELAALARDRDSSEFETLFEDLGHLIGSVQWRDDDNIASRFRNLTADPAAFEDRALFDRLKARGATHLENKNYGELRYVVSQLYAARSKPRQVDSDDGMFDDVNVIRS